jgi:hypothetical protein
MIKCANESFDRDLDTDLNDSDLENTDDMDIDDTDTI